MNRKKNRVTRVEDIDPKSFYSRADLESVMMHRGVPLSLFLKHDPLAPKGENVGTSVLTQGADILEYINNHDDVRQTQVDVKAQTIISNAKNIAAVEISNLIYDALARIKREITSNVEIIINKFSRNISKESNSACGIYFLKKDRQIVYIGQSVNVYARVRQHSMGKDFDEVHFMPCDKDDLNEIEGFLIRLLRPPLNGGSSSAVNMIAPKSSLFTELINITERVGLFDG